MSKNVHTEHCCKHHGCKYGEDEFCPVVLGLQEQSHLCELCDDDLGWIDEEDRDGICI